MVRRLFVEKKSGFDVEARHMLADIRNSLNPEGLTALRLFNRYDVEGLSQEEFDQAKTTIFSEPNVDHIYEETLPVLNGTVFATEYLPGQYDQRADSAAQCVQLLTQGQRPVVATAQVIALEGTLSDHTITKIKAFLVNPVESRLASMDKPDTLESKLERPRILSV